MAKSHDPKAGAKAGAKAEGAAGPEKGAKADPKAEAAKRLRARKMTVTVFGKGKGGRKAESVALAAEHVLSVSADGGRVVTVDGRKLEVPGA